MPLHKDSRLHEFMHLLDISPFYKQKQKSNECTTLQENLSTYTVFSNYLEKAFQATEYIPSYR